MGSNIHELIAQETHHKPTKKEKIRRPARESAIKKLMGSLFDDKDDEL
jgi:hypothetical protein